MSGKYTKKSSFPKLPMIIGILVMVLLLVLCLTMCQSGDNAEPTEPTTETTEPGGETTAATTEAAADPTEEETDPTEHSHTYTETVTAATCTADGFTLFSCECGDSYEGSYMTAPGHSYGEWETIKEATKTATGTAQRKCSACGATESKTLPKIIEGHTHNYTSEVTTAATCTTEGVKTFTCTCGDAYTESISKVSHDYSSKVTAATCSANGYTTYTCKVCGNSYKDNYVNASGHSWGSWVTTKAATESATGVATRTCSACGEKQTKTLEKLAHTHSYSSKVTTAATCGSDGVKTFTCNCGESYTEAISKTGNHSYGDWVTTKEPTLTSTGTAKRTCSICGSSETKTLPKVESSTHTHEWGEWVTTKAPTTSSTGTAERSCLTFGCGVTETKTLPKVESSEHSHSWGSWVTVAPTCTADGYKYRSCSSCGAEETATGSAATGHSYSSTVTKSATCSSEGVCTYTCSACGHSYTSTIAKADHSWVHHHTDEVGHNEGYMVCHCGKWKCSVNADYVTSFYNHVMSEGDIGTCSYYSYTEWVIDTPASDYYECSVCGATK